MVIPVARGGAWLRAAMCACFVFLGLAILLSGPAATSDTGGAVMLGGMGGFVALMFGYLLTQDLRTIRSNGLHLSPSGLRYIGHQYPWTAIAELRIVGPQQAHIRLTCRAGAELRGAARFSAALGRIGFYTAPAYISIRAFDSGNLPLLHILDRWLAHYQSGDRRADPE